jgi:CoA:oxalate CoA-transferase
VFQDPQILAQEMVMDVDHPGYGLVRMLGFPIKFSGRPCRVRRPAPRLGEHTNEVLTDLGYAAADLGAWQRDGEI